jgi:hypothetical protein
MMEKFWMYFGLVMAGVVLGMIIEERIGVARTIIKGKLKIKQRGRGNVLDSDIKLPDKPETKREERIIERTRKRIERKKRRALKRLEKNS